jgi:creatinine amidohydrolase
MMAFPGTTSVTDVAFGLIARDVAESAITAGFKDVVLMGDHGGGQQVLESVAAQLTTRLRRRPLKRASLEILASPRPISVRSISI